MSQENSDDGARALAVIAPRALAAGANVGAVAIEQERAIAEAQGQLILAKRFPRSVAGATADFLDSCKMPEFAEAAFYSVPNRGNGPSIRFAEEAARCYGNFEFGHRELSRTDGKSEIEVYAWDKEKNNRSVRQITVVHTVDTKNGPKPLRDQADIDNRIANIASKQVRGRILALLPKGMVAAGILEAKKTLAGDNTAPVSARIVKMTAAFSPYGVTPEMLETHLGHKLDQTTVDELAELHGIYNAIREGAKPSEYFGAAKEEVEDPGAALAAAGKANPGKADAEKPAADAKQQPKAQEESKTEEPKVEEPKAEKVTEAKSEPAAETETPPATETKAEAPAAQSKAVF